MSTIADDTHGRVNLQSLGREIGGIEILWLLGWRWRMEIEVFLSIEHDDSVVLVLVPPLLVFLLF